eukprot:366550-Chlamydomonas_euryale.AAC.8
MRAACAGIAFGGSACKDSGRRAGHACTPWHVPSAWAASAAAAPVQTSAVQESLRLQGACCNAIRSMRIETKFCMCMAW